MMSEIKVVKTTTYHIQGVVIDFMKFDARYRSIRGNMKYKGFSCFSCKRDFVDGEDIGLIMTSKGNKVVCKSCAEKIEEELLEEE